MKKCPKCNEEVKTTDKFCRACGESLKPSKKGKKNEEEAKETKSTINTDEIFNKIGDGFEKLLDTDDTSKDYTKKDIEDNKGLALISYMGPFVFIPYFCGKDSDYVKYHAKQGMNLFIVWVMYLVIYSLLSLIKVTKKCTLIMGQIISCDEVTPWWVTFPLGLIGFALFAISVVGIVYTVMGKAKKLPVIGKLNIIK